MAATIRKKPQIDSDQIVTEALELVNETRLAGLTMRVLAERLGIRAASLYWHFPNKAALISAMSEALFIRAIKNVPDADNWQDWMRGVGHAVWDNLITYPDSGLIVMTANPTEEQFSRMSKIIREMLQDFDIDVEDGFRLHSGIQALITGWVTFAHSPFIDQLEAEMDVKQSAMQTLDAMINGWQAKLKKAETKS